MLKKTEDLKTQAEYEELLKETDGHCPCMPQRNEDTKCPCKDMRENDICICGLYV